MAVSSILQQLLILSALCTHQTRPRGEVRQENLKIFHHNGDNACALISRRTVLLVFRHAVDSKQHGGSVPASWWFGQGHPGREVRPEREAVQEGSPHPSHRASLCAAVLSTCVLTVLHLGSGCRPTARKGFRHTGLVFDQRPPCWNGSRPFRKQGQRTRWTPVKQF